MKKDRINIVYEDKFIIIVNKPAHLLTISTDNEKEKTLFHKVINYEKSKNKNNKVFIVHRLDRDTSGLIIFAKSERVKKELQDNWDSNVKRKYIAVLEGKLDKKEATIKNYLVENKNHMVYSTQSNKEGKLAITKYKEINISKSYSLVDIEILTGRKNQIRVHMNDLGCPIIGDKKYGAKTNPLKRLGLHAYYLGFTHPVLRDRLEIEIKYPEQFVRMFKNNVKR